MMMEDPTTSAEGGGIGGGREGGGRKTKEGVTLVRIDHSDVYIENERLNDELAHSLDSIHRSGYKKLMNCDFEITAIRKSLLRMRKDNPKLHESKRSKFRSPRSRTLLTRATKTTLATTAATPPPKETNINSNVIRKDAQGSRRLTPGTTLKNNSIEIKMPRTNYHEHDDTSSSDSDGNDNADDDDNDDDNDNNNDSDSDSINSDNDNNDDDDEDEIDGRGFHNRHYHDANNTTGTTITTTTTSTTNRTTRRSCFSSKRPEIVTSMGIKGGDVITSGKPKSGRGGGGGGMVKHRGDLLKNLMSRLNLEKVPPAWYTDVVPASDIYVSKRYVVGTGGGRDRDRKSRRGRVQGRGTGTGRYGGKNQQPPAAVRPSTTSGDIFSGNNAQAFHNHNNNSNNNNQRRNGNMNNTLKQRPYTSLGLKINNSNSYHTRCQNNELRPDSRSRSKQAFGNDDDNNNNINNNTNTKLKYENMLNGNVDSSSSYHRERPMNNVTKTVRQLKEEALGTLAVRPHSAVEVLLQEAKVERALIEDRVKSFVRSLEEGKKTERLKKMMSRSMILHSQQQKSS